jgi:cytidylate kinase
MDEKDAARKKYHNYHCPGKWGDSRIYDLSINSSRLGIDATVAILTTYIDDKMAAQK